jgi:hypothetical protein
MMGAAFYGFKEAVAGASCDRLSFFATIFLSPLRLFPDGLRPRRARFSFTEKSYCLYVLPPKLKRYKNTELKLYFGVFTTKAVVRFFGYLQKPDFMIRRVVA